jgi:mono/diheme cytochrome c family protein
MRNNVYLSSIVKVGVLTGGSVFLLILTLILAGCGGQSAPTSNTGSTTLTSTTSSPTYSQYAAEGQILFSVKCSLCHGDKGQGGQAPAIIGAGAALAKYSTALGLLEKISKTMPMNSPGSLSHQEYLQLEAYLLTQNNYVGASQTFNEANLKDLALK